MVVVTVLNVLVAAALPAWSAVDQREKEEELIFRGLQYAEGIRVFQARFGRLPVRLEELIEVEPRSIRQLWPDPLTGKPVWGLIFATQGSNPNTVPGAAVPSPLPQPGQRQPAGPRATSGGDQVTVGPIAGVYSLAEGEGTKTFLGSQRYEDWRFTVELLLQNGGQRPQPGATDANGRPLQPTLPQPQQQAPPGQPQAFVGQLANGVAPDLSARWIGRPWPPGLQEQMALGGAPGAIDGGLPGQGGQNLGQPPGAAQGQPNDGRPNARRR